VRAIDGSPTGSNSLMTKKAYERQKKKDEGRTPWSSSNKMHYLRLSKGRRKPTGQEMAMTINHTLL